MLDTGLTIANPAYGLYRLFGGKTPGSSDGGGLSAAVTTDPTSLDAYKAQQAKLAALDAQEVDAEKRRMAALQALAALSAQASPYGAPIQVQVPSFALPSLPGLTPLPALADPMVAVGDTGWSGDEDYDWSAGSKDTVLDAFWAALTMGASTPITAALHKLRKQDEPTGKVHDITRLDAYKAAQARAQAVTQRGQQAQLARQQALRALAAVNSAPLQSYKPIAVNVPSFAIGEDDE